MSNNESDRRTDDDDDESTHLLPRDVTVMSCDVDKQHNNDGHGPSSSAAVKPCSAGSGGEILNSHISSLVPADVFDVHGRSDIRHLLSRNVKRLSVDSVVCSDEGGGGGGIADGGRASLLPRQSMAHCVAGYGTLYNQKLSRLRRLSFAEVVERITLTWENIDVYAPPVKSAPTLLRRVYASPAVADSVQPKHILKDGKDHVHQMAIVSLE